MSWSIVFHPYRIKLILEGIEEEGEEEEEPNSTSLHKMTTTLEISMISASGYKSRHTQPECGYALEPSRWTEYSIHTMDPDNLELTFEFFEVIFIWLSPVITPFTYKLCFLFLCNCLNLITGRHECTCCRRRCSSWTCGHCLPPVLILLRHQQGLRSSHTSNNGTKCQTDNRESQR